MFVYKNNIQISNTDYPFQGTAVNIYTKEDSDGGVYILQIYIYVCIYAYK